MNLFAIKKNVRLYQKFVLKCHSESVHDKVTRIYDIYMDEVKIIEAHLFFAGLVLFWREESNFKFVSFHKDCPRNGVLQPYPHKFLFINDDVVMIMMLRGLL